MQYHVGRNQQPLGQFTEDQIRSGLEQGSFQPTDMVWGEGMAEWRPLDQVFGFAAAYTLGRSSASHVPLGDMARPMVMASASPGNIGVMPMPGSAIASLVLGILSFLSFAFCALGGVLAIPGAICGHMALSQIKKSGGRLQGRGMALAGVIISYVTMAVILLFMVVFGLIIGISAAAGSK